MTNLELVDPKHPALHTKAVLDPFEDNTIDWEDTEQSMFYLMDRFMGVGLASPQVGLSHRMFVMTFETGENVGVYNPEILEYSENTVPIEEGCLTFPFVFLPLKRARKVVVKYEDEQGDLKEANLDGQMSRIFQHEFDHIMGRVMIERASKLKIDMAYKKAEKQMNRYRKMSKKK